MKAFFTGGGPWDEQVKEIPSGAPYWNVYFPQELELFHDVADIPPTTPAPRIARYRFAGHSPLGISVYLYEGEG